jgi:prepilin-type processing-associated H-X9-DG protein
MIQWTSVTCRGKSEIVRKLGNKSSDPMSLPKHSRFGSGFTLTELLIMVTLIGVLFALLFPTFGSFRDKTLSAKCVGNLKSIGAAIGINISDNGGKWLVMDQMYGSWDKTMRDRGILSSDKASFCPSCKPKSYELYRTYGATWMGNTAVPEDKSVLLYSTNSQGTRTYYEVNTVAISQPSKFLIMADSYSTRNNGGQYHIVQGNTGMDEIHLRHNGRANVLFADGHVNALDPKGLKEIGWRMAFDQKNVITNF